MADHYVEITITAPIPEGQKTLGHKAIVETEAAAHAIVQQLHDMGLSGARQTRDIRKRKALQGAAAVPAVPDEG